MGDHDKSPDVSIITPVFNATPHLEETLNSVLAQSSPDWEHILIDDGSQDGSAAIIKRYAASDSRITLIRLEKNAGAAVARNAGIEAAKGRFIAFLDSDDLWLPEKLSAQVAFMESTGAALSYTGYEVMKEDGERTGEVSTAAASLSYRDMLRYNQIGCLTAMYDTRQVGKVYMPELRKRQDYALWLRILRQTGTARGLDQVLALYRQRSGSISRNKLDLIRYHWRLFREFEELSVARSAYYLAWNILGRLVKK
ncbi:glycosyltransferase family 2 protein [Halomonas lysinitropha]|uniref:Teichuronic acid biosynthesis glycosyltransferase TuaG n=1 Tax=Halomonas lysinitropha TaxID=2607506 RepID=A0A5K1IBN4_9GAMM|nr:glycosyltransferase family 2 protein [Halomonas lysinitropha]VVZ97082.1 Putative teichuronic acid biosynthesis glycosyltransferase TuaG [Halomonas lysinitropha]